MASLSENLDSPNINQAVRTNDGNKCANDRIVFVCVPALLLHYSFLVEVSDVAEFM